MIKIFSFNLKMTVERSKCHCFLTLIFYSREYFADFIIFVMEYGGFLRKEITKLIKFS